MRTLYNSKDFLTKSLGMSPKLFCAMMDVAPLVLLEYPRKDKKSQKFLLFHSPCIPMFELNTFIASVGDDAPDPNVLYCKNTSSLAHIIQLMAFVLTRNSSSCAKKYIHHITTKDV